MVNRRRFLIASGVGLGAVGGLLGCSRKPAGAAAPAAPMVVGPAPQPPAPQGYVALADALTGRIGIDRMMVDRSFQQLAAVVPQLDVLSARLAQALPTLSAQADPQARLAALEAQSPALKDVFLRINTALYLGTIEDKDGQRVCFAYETTASNQVTAAMAQPPSYCTGSPNFWVDMPATATATQELSAHG